MAIAALRNLGEFPKDVDIRIFLTGDLEEDKLLYEQPEGFIALWTIGQVCRLVKVVVWLKARLPKTDSRSTSGYVFTLGGAAISWNSSKQTVIAKSKMESEFIALDECGEEAKWLRQFVEDIPRWPKPVTAISIHCDSKSAMGRAKSTMYNRKSRHIRCRHNSIRQLLSTGVISIDYVASKDNIADPFTKGLSRELVSKSSKGMGLKPLKE
ncbi:hypothetical protein Tco_0648823 [Tanacetum coccineum]